MKLIARFILGVCFMGVWGSFCIPSFVQARSKAKQQYIEFSYEKTDLKTIIHDIAYRKGVNVIYQQADMLKATVTFDAKEKIMVSEAWNLVINFLNDAGYQLVPQSDTLYKVVQRKNAYVEAIPTYINGSYTDLEDNAQIVRLMYYFQNMDAIKTQNNQQLKSLLQSYLSAADASKSVIWDTIDNGIVITGESRVVKGVMQLLETFDEAGFKQEIELLTLDYAQAADVEKLLNSLITGKTSTPAKGQNFIAKMGSNKVSAVFSRDTKIITLNAQKTLKKNMLAFVGKKTDIAKIIEFIKKYIDVPLQEGKSLFHVIDIEWQDASTLAGVLQSLILGKSNSGQSQSVDLSDLAFDPQIQIIAPKQSEVTMGKSGKDGEGQQNVAFGNNCLLIAATERDWKRLQKVIKLLDVPRKQVIIESMILDLNVMFQRQLASQLRTRGFSPRAFPKDIQAQAGMFTQIITDGDTEKTLLGDFTKLFDSSGSSGSGPEGAAYDALTDGGTTLVYSNGNRSHGAWAFFQMLSSHSNTKVISKPFAVAQNNTTATAKTALTRRLPADVVGKVAAQTNYKDQSAETTIHFQPLISKDNAISLTINIDIEEFFGASTSSNRGDRTTRTVNSNVLLKSGDVMILGGLTNESLIESHNSVPFFSRIPILGNLFSSRSKTTNKSQLFVLVRATVIEPRTKGGMGHLTRQAFREVNSELTAYDDVFSNLKDPVSRWFFDNNSKSFTKEFDSSVTEILTDTTAASAAQRAADLKTEEQLQRENLQKAVAVYNDYQDDSYVTQSIQEQRKRRPGLQTFIKPVTQA